MIGVLPPWLPETDWFDGVVEFTDGFNIWELLQFLLSAVSTLVNTLYNVVAFFFTPISTLVDQSIGDSGFLFELFGDLVAGVLSVIPVANGYNLGDMSIFGLMFCVGLFLYVIFSVIRFVLNLFGV